MGDVMGGEDPFGLVGTSPGRAPAGQVVDVEFVRALWAWNEVSGRWQLLTVVPEAAALEGPDEAADVFRTFIEGVRRGMGESEDGRAELANIRFLIVPGAVPLPDMVEPPEGDGPARVRVWGREDQV